MLREGGFQRPSLIALGERILRSMRGIAKAGGFFSWYGKRWDITLSGVRGGRKSGIQVFTLSIGTRIYRKTLDPKHVSQDLI